MRKNAFACGLILVAAFATYAQDKKRAVRVRNPSAADDRRDGQLR